MGDLEVVYKGIHIGISAFTLFYILKQHKVWIRMKDRVEEMYVDFCYKHGLRYKPLDANGENK